MFFKIQPVDGITPKRDDNLTLRKSQSCYGTPRPVKKITLSEYPKEFLNLKTDVCGTPKLHLEPEGFFYAHIRIGNSPCTTCKDIYDPLRLHESTSLSFYTAKNSPFKLQTTPDKASDIYVNTKSNHKINSILKRTTSVPNYEDIEKRRYERDTFYDNPKGKPSIFRYILDSFSSKTDEERDIKKNKPSKISFAAQAEYKCHCTKCPSCKSTETDSPKKICEETNTEQIKSMFDDLQPYISAGKLQNCLKYTDIKDHKILVPRSSIKYVEMFDDTDNSNSKPSSIIPMGPNLWNKSHKNSDTSIKNYTKLSQTSCREPENDASKEIFFNAVLNTPDKHSGEITKNIYVPGKPYDRKIETCKKESYIQCSNIKSVIEPPVKKKNIPKLFRLENDSLKHDGETKVLLTPDDEFFEDSCDYERTENELDCNRDIIKMQKMNLKGKTFSKSSVKSVCCVPNTKYYSDTEDEIYVVCPGVYKQDNISKYPKKSHRIQTRPKCSVAKSTETRKNDDIGGTEEYKLANKSSSNKSDDSYKSTYMMDKCEILINPFKNENFISSSNISCRMTSPKKSKESNNVADDNAIPVCQTSKNDEFYVSDTESLLGNERSKYEKNEREKYEKWPFQPNSELSFFSPKNENYMAYPCRSKEITNNKTNCSIAKEADEYGSLSKPKNSSPKCAVSRVGCLKEKMFNILDKHTCSKKTIKYVCVNYVNDSKDRTGSEKYIECPNISNKCKKRRSFKNLLRTSSIHLDLEKHFRVNRKEPKEFGEPDIKVFNKEIYSNESYPEIPIDDTSSFYESPGESLLETPSLYLSPNVSDIAFKQEKRNSSTCLIISKKNKRCGCVSNLQDKKKNGSQIEITDIRDKMQKSIMDLAHGYTSAVTSRPSSRHPSHDKRRMIQTGTYVCVNRPEDKKLYKEGIHVITCTKRHTDKPKPQEKAKDKRPKSKEKDGNKKTEPVVLYEAPEKPLEYEEDIEDSNFDVFVRPSPTEKCPTICEPKKQKKAHSHTPSPIKRQASSTSSQFPNSYKPTSDGSIPCEPCNPNIKYIPCPNEPKVYNKESPKNRSDCPKLCVKQNDEKKSKKPKKKKSSDSVIYGQAVSQQTSIICERASRKKSKTSWESFKRKFKEKLSRCCRSKSRSKSPDKRSLKCKEPCADSLKSSKGKGRAPDPPAKTETAPYDRKPSRSESPDRSPTKDTECFPSCPVQTEPKRTPSKKEYPIYTDRCPAKLRTSEDTPPRKETTDRCPNSKRSPKETSPKKNSPSKERSCEHIPQRKQVSGTPSKRRSICSVDCPANNKKKKRKCSKKKSNSSRSNDSTDGTPSKRKSNCSVDCPAINKKKKRKCCKKKSNSSCSNDSTDTPKKKTSPQKSRKKPSKCQSSQTEPTENIPPRDSIYQECIRTPSTFSCSSQTADQIPPKKKSASGSGSKKTPSITVSVCSNYKVLPCPIKTPSTVYRSPGTEASGRQASPSFHKKNPDSKNACDCTHTCVCQSKNLSPENKSYDRKESESSSSSREDYYCRISPEKESTSISKEYDDRLYTTRPCDSDMCNKVIDLSLSCNSSSTQSMYQEKEAAYFETNEDYVEESPAVFKKPIKLVTCNSTKCNNYCTNEHEKMRTFPDDYLKKKNSSNIDSSKYGSRKNKYADIKEANIYELNIPSKNALIVEHADPVTQIQECPENVLNIVTCKHPTSNKRKKISKIPKLDKTSTVSPNEVTPKKGRKDLLNSKYVKRSSMANIIFDYSLQTHYKSNKIKKTTQKSASKVNYKTVKKTIMNQHTTCRNTIKKLSVASIASSCAYFSFKSCSSGCPNMCSSGNILENSCPFAYVNKSTHSCRLHSGANKRSSATWKSKDCLCEDSFSRQQFIGHEKPTLQGVKIKNEQKNKGKVRKKSKCSNTSSKSKKSSPNSSRKSSSVSVRENLQSKRHPNVSNTSNKQSTRNRISGLPCNGICSFESFADNRGQVRSPNSTRNGKGKSKSSLSEKIRFLLKNTTNDKNKTSKASMQTKENKSDHLVSSRKKWKDDIPKMPTDRTSKTSNFLEDFEESCLYVNKDFHSRRKKPKKDIKTTETFNNRTPYHSTADPRNYDYECPYTCKKSDPKLSKKERPSNYRSTSSPDYLNMNDCRCPPMVKPSEKQMSKKDRVKNVKSQTHSIDSNKSEDCICPFEDKDSVLIAKMDYRPNQNYRNNSHDSVQYCEPCEYVDPSLSNEPGVINHVPHIKTKKGQRKEPTEPKTPSRTSIFSRKFNKPDSKSLKKDSKNFRSKPSTSSSCNDDNCPYIFKDPKHSNSKISQKKNKSPTNTNPYFNAQESDDPCLNKTYGDETAKRKSGKLKENEIAIRPSTSPSKKPMFEKSYHRMCNIDACPKKTSIARGKKTPGSSIGSHKSQKGSRPKTESNIRKSTTNFQNIPTANYSDDIPQKNKYPIKKRSSNKLERKSKTPYTDDVPLKTKSPKKKSRVESNTFRKLTSDKDYRQKNDDDDKCRACGFNKRSYTCNQDDCVTESLERRSRVSSTRRSDKDPIVSCNSVSCLKDTYPVKSMTSNSSELLGMYDQLFPSSDRKQKNNRRPSSASKESPKKKSNVTVRDSIPSHRSFFQESPPSEISPSRSPVSHKLYLDTPTPSLSEQSNDSKNYKAFCPSPGSGKACLPTDGCLCDSYNIYKHSVSLKKLFEKKSAYTSIDDYESGSKLMPTISDDSFLIRKRSKFIPSDNMWSNDSTPQDRTPTTMKSGNSSFSSVIRKSGQADVIPPVDYKEFIKSIDTYLKCKMDKRECAGKQEKSPTSTLVTSPDKNCESDEKIKNTQVSKKQKNEKKKTQKKVQNNAQALRCIKACPPEEKLNVGIQAKRSPKPRLTRMKGLLAKNRHNNDMAQISTELLHRKLQMSKNTENKPSCLDCREGSANILNIVKDTCSPKSHSPSLKKKKFKEPRRSLSSIRTKRSSTGSRKGTTKKCKNKKDRTCSAWNTAQFIWDDSVNHTKYVKKCPSNIKKDMCTSVTKKDSLINRKSPCTPKILTCETVIKDPCFYNVDNIPCDAISKEEPNICRPCSSPVERFCSESVSKCVFTPPLLNCTPQRDTFSMVSNNSTATRKSSCSCTVGRKCCCITKQKHEVNNAARPVIYPKWTEPQPGPGLIQYKDRINSFARYDPTGSKGVDYSEKLLDLVRKKKKEIEQLRIKLDTASRNYGSNIACKQITPEVSDAKIIDIGKTSIDSPIVSPKKTTNPSPRPISQRMSFVDDPPYCSMSNFLSETTYKNAKCNEGDVPKFSKKNEYYCRGLLPRWIYKQNTISDDTEI